MRRSDLPIARFFGVMATGMTLGAPVLAAAQSTSTAPPISSQHSTPSDSEPAANARSLPATDQGLLPTQAQGVNLKIRDEPPETLGTQRPSMSTGYHKGFFIKAADDKFSLKINVRVQALGAMILDQATQEADAAFSIPRARFSFSGHAFNKAIRYKFQADFGKGFVNLKDFYIDYTIMPKVLRLRVGEFKRPFSRQQINSSGRLALVDRAITDKYFGSGRDVGITLHNGYSKSPTFEYAVGIFNGTGDKAKFSANTVVDVATGEAEILKGKFSNVPTHMHPMLVARAGYNYGGIKGYSEVDFEGGPLRFAVAGSGLMDLDGDRDNESSMRAEVDYALKLNGFSSTGAVYISSAQAGRRFKNRALEAMGMHIQAGYLIAGRFQPSVRYAVIQPTEGLQEQEIMGGFSVFFFEHGFKWQTDGGMLRRKGKTNGLVRTEMQLSF